MNDELIEQHFSISRSYGVGRCSSCYCQDIEPGRLFKAQDRVIAALKMGFGIGGCFADRPLAAVRL
ncbi:hypothetical protein AB664_10720 [Brucella anthropi]|uniref:Uncharacterized protein n=1 Tax=Brucella anthropi TaxID=529 RepID=A0A656Z3R9_BRUAN|nr:hypothetical protein AB664_10720 [Brucella anthropi]